MEEAVYMMPNPVTPNQCVTIDAHECQGCNSCIEVCRTDVMVPNSEKGKPPVVLYPSQFHFPYRNLPDKATFLVGRKLVRSIPALRFPLLTFESVK